MRRSSSASTLHFSLNRILFRSRNTLVSAKRCQKCQSEAARGDGEVKRGLGLHFRSEPTRERAKMASSSSSSSSLRQTTTSATRAAARRWPGRTPAAAAVVGRSVGREEGQKRDLWQTMERTTFWGRLVFLALNCQKRRFPSFPPLHRAGHRASRVVASGATF